MSVCPQAEACSAGSAFGGGQLGSDECRVYCQARPRRTSSRLTSASGSTSVSAVPRRMAMTASGRVIMR